VTDTPLLGAELATALTASYWDGLARGELVLQRCEDCGTWQHYPRRLCHACWSPRVTPTTAGGRGRVLAAAVSHRTPKPALRDRLPLTIGLVALAEGPVLLTLLHGELRAGDAVRHDDARTHSSQLLTFTADRR
jgi:uncharacterized OB-fold protein